MVNITTMCLNQELTTECKVDIPMRTEMAIINEVSITRTKADITMTITKWDVILINKEDNTVGTMLEEGIRVRIENLITRQIIHADNKVNRLYIISAVFATLSQTKQRVELFTVDSNLVKLELHRRDKR